MNKKIYISIIMAFVALGGYWFYSNQQSGISQRQTMIHQTGSQVMPFDLNKTTHVFKKENDGGVQQVIAKDSSDTEQISLIRMHLQMEASSFQKGNFVDPSALHGADMPGVQTLSKGASNIRIIYSDLPNGGQITYSTDTPDLITAIHAWFDAHVSDHGNDAMKM